jgi:hypothetical protein
MKARSTSRSDARMRVTLPARECMTWQVRTQRRLELSYDEKLNGFDVDPEDIHEEADNYELFVFPFDQTSAEENWLAPSSATEFARLTRCASKPGSEINTGNESIVQDDGRPGSLFTDTPSPTLEGNKMHRNSDDFKDWGLFYTDPSITDETLTPESLRELARLKMHIVEAMLKHWTTDVNEEALASHIEILALELNGLTPDFIRALAEVMKVPASV